MTAGRLVSRGSAIAHLANRPAAGVGLVVAAAIGMALAIGGATLLMRRIGGGFAVTPGPSVAWPVAAAGTALVLATTVCAGLGGDRWPPWLARGGLVAAALAVAPIGAGLAWPERLAAAAAMTVALVAALAPPPTLRPLGPAWAGWRSRWATPLRPAAPLADPRSDGVAPPPPAPDEPQPTELQELTEPAAGWGPPPVGFRQRLERIEAAGEDRLRGLVMVAVSTGSRSGQAHVGFCPSFKGLPLVEVSTTCDLVEAAVTAAEVLPWGVRIECRLSEPAEEPLEIPVEILARRPA